MTQVKRTAAINDRFALSGLTGSHRYSMEARLRRARAMGELLRRTAHCLRHGIAGIARRVRTMAGSFWSGAPKQRDSANFAQSSADASAQLDGKTKRLMFLSAAASFAGGLPTSGCHLCALGESNAQTQGNGTN
jgi:hypothetical protein